MDLNGKPVVKSNGAAHPVTREELMSVVRGIADSLSAREKSLTERFDKTLHDRLIREPRSITVATNPQPDTSLIELALNSLVTRAVDQAKVLEQGQAALPGLVRELVQGIAESLAALQLTVHPQVTAPDVQVVNEVAVPQVFNQVDVPATVVDLSDIGAAVTEMSGLARRQSAALEKNTEAMRAVAQELKLLRTKKIKRTVTRDSNGDIESVTEEAV